MNKGWLELESDPGLFTLLLEDFGVKGVQVEEIYDLQKPMEGPVYGFIFLFRWIEERRSRRKANTEDESFVTDDDAVNSIFFAQQIIPNSCATHALLSVLLNTSKVHLGETLTRVKDFTRHMNPEDKGYAIGNMPDLARAHNSHARPEPKHLPEKQSGISAVRAMDSESFHFVSYVPINGHLFELDGLKPYPIDHGPWDKTEDWTEKFRRVITERLGIATSGEPYHDICFNLMVVVPDKRQLYEQKLTTLRTNRAIVWDALQQSLQQVDQAHATATNNTTSNTTTTTTTVTTKSVKKESDEENKEIPEANESCAAKREKKADCTSSQGEAASDLDKKTKNEGDTSMEQSACVKEERETLDVTKPLTIETKFTNAALSGPSSESTDTASEVGSGFSSPGSITAGSCQSSPHLTAEAEENGSGMKEEGERKRKRRSNHGAFTPKDLLDLLKNVENEIELCEATLKEEYEKRKKYKIDDCRRTHNYDSFVTTFLKMLAEQGHLAELVEHNLMGPCRPSNTPTRAKPSTTATSAGTRTLTKTAAATAARRRSRPKRRR
ncbi:ubiquitin carboxyl-terminal hydrolase BAP1-like isoform X1 [Pomacea canaliculata]|uniref:ubiquitin carboxyl-terminal hydrolase BAP1-like isoform X1 n=1 Tax=Pomacea canaliculata TaxID=400727 RepID=UPI000D72D93E|nr:ubiquitin carboxyl-terminal hydrolase BAP1-like isoform X1 [Pomacea canaliculata]XP_025106986.1 ubiquitin carboxyl-terminal hydrolase BAP1-like isoform X1 [Pomacea canaliculata]